MEVKCIRIPPNEMSFLDFKLAIERELLITGCISRSKIEDMLGKYYGPDGRAYPIGQGPDGPNDPPDPYDW